MRPKETGRMKRRKMSVQKEKERAKIRIMSKNGKTKYQDKAKGKRTIYSIMLESLTDLNSKRLNRILVEESI